MRLRPTLRLLTQTVLDSKNLRMEPLLKKLQSQLAELPVSVSLVLPGQRRLGPADAAVRLDFKDWSSVATLAAFSRALRTTLVGSMMPSLTMSQ